MTPPDAHVSHAGRQRAQEAWISGRFHHHVPSIPPALFLSLWVRSRRAPQVAPDCPRNTRPHDHPTWASFQGKATIPMAAGVGTRVLEARPLGG